MIRMMYMISQRVTLDIIAISSDVFISRRDFRCVSITLVLCPCQCCESRGRLVSRRRPNGQSVVKETIWRLGIQPWHLYSVSSGGPPWIKEFLLQVSPPCPSLALRQANPFCVVVLISQYFANGYCELWVGQGCISCGTCSYPELTEDHVLTSAYVKIFRIDTRNAVNIGCLKEKKIVLDLP